MRKINMDGIIPVEIQGHTSKGDQPKWLLDGIWYKADHMGYEALAEVIISQLLAKTNLTDFLLYEPVRINYNSKERTGCASTNFKADNERLVPIEKLHRAYYGKGLSSVLGRMETVTERISYTVGFIEDITGLQAFGKYLTAIIEIDTLFLNEDRHTNNIAVIRNDKTKAYRLCPIFDNGLSLLSDLNDYPIEGDFYKQIAKVRCKPFSTSFDEQLDAAEEMYGVQIRAIFTRKDVENGLALLSEYYPPAVLERVKKVVFEQMRKYQHLFKLN